MHFFPHLRWCGWSLTGSQFPSGMPESNGLPWDSIPLRGVVHRMMLLPSTFRVFKCAEPGLPRLLFPPLSQHHCCLTHWLPEHLPYGPQNQIRAVHCFNYFLLVWSGGYLVWGALLQALSLINTTLRASCTSTGMVQLSTCVASAWYDTVASIYNYKKKLLYVDYLVFFFSDCNYLHKFQLNPRTEVSLEIYT